MVKTELKTEEGKLETNLGSVNDSNMAVACSWGKVIIRAGKWWLNHIDIVINHVIIQFSESVSEYRQ